MSTPKQILKKASDPTVGNLPAGTGRRLHVRRPAEAIADRRRMVSHRSVVLPPSAAVPGGDRSEGRQVHARRRRPDAAVSGLRRRALDATRRESARRSRSVCRAHPRRGPLHARPPLRPKFSPPNTGLTLPDEKTLAAELERTQAELEHRTAKKKQPAKKKRKVGANA